MNIKGLALLTAGLFLVLSASRAPAQILIEIGNVDGPGEGLNDPTPVAPVGGNEGKTRGEQRMNAFRYAAQLWSRRLSTPVPIKIQAQFDPLDCAPTKAILGYAGALYLFADFPGVPKSNTYFPSPLANKFAGKDLNNDFPSAGPYHIQTRFNSSLDGNSCTFPRRWYYGFDEKGTANDIDFITIVNHELTHGLGFATYYNQETGAKKEGKDDIFLTFLLDKSTNKSWSNMTDAERVASSKNTGNLVWNGSTVNRASGSFTAGVDPAGRFLMYAPAKLEPGSSVTHWDTSLTPAETLKPFYENPAHTSTVSRDLLTDIGWGPPSSSDGDLLFLSNGRVTVSLTWRNQFNGKTGKGTPVKQLDQYGYFWFDSPENPEVFVKVLDFGGPSFLVFHSALSDLEYEVVFTVLRTGLSYRFTRPAGSVCGLANGDTVQK